MKEVKQYVVGTNGLTGRCKYQAADPDEALMFAYRHERFLRVTRHHPSISPAQAMQIAKDESTEMPDFRIDFCCIEQPQQQ